MAVTGGDFPKSQSTKAWRMRVSYANGIKRLWRIVNATKAGAYTTALALTGALSAYCEGQMGVVRNNQSSLEIMRLS